MSNHSNMIIEQRNLTNKGLRRCTKCKQVSSNNKSNFYGERSLCKKCEKENALSRYYLNKDNQPLISIFKTRINAAKARSKKKGLIFNLCLEDLLQLWQSQRGLCFYTGLEMETNIQDYHNPKVISLDRINSKLGYHKDNLVLCCDSVNTMKNNLSFDEFKQIIKLIFNRFNQ